MSVIAWDGRMVAADKQATNSWGATMRSTKLRLLPTGEVIAWAGRWDVSQALVAWYEAGADPELWPELQREKDESTLVVVSAAGARQYGREPAAIAIEEPFMAWGQGADFARGAMAMGANARTAVEVAIRFADGCGLGVDSINLARPQQQAFADHELLRGLNGAATIAAAIQAAAAAEGGGADDAL